MQEGSRRLWAFLIAVYWVSFVTYFLLWKAYKHVSDLRAEALRSPEVKHEQFAPDGQTTTEQVDSFSKDISPEVKHEQFAIIVRDIPPPPYGQTRKEQVATYFKTIYPETFYRSMLVTNNKKVCC